MLVANSFDLWQKDTFFYAAEEVQQSADIMVSAYRTWVRERKEGMAPEYLEELTRELQMALGTARWQLEEFERAVRLSYRGPADAITMARHNQFISAIEDQISNVEVALKESFGMEGRQPLHWVNLNEKERDDLALFLSGSPVTSPPKTDLTKDDDFSAKFSSEEDIRNQASGAHDVIARNMDPVHVLELEAKGTHQTRTNADCLQADQRVSNRRTWNSPNVTNLKVVIDYKDKQTHPSDTDSTSRDTPVPASSSAEYKDHPQGEQGIVSVLLCRRINLMHRLFGRVGGSKRQLQTAPMHPFGFSMSFFLVLMLTIFLVVPFVFIQLRSK